MKLMWSLEIIENKLYKVSGSIKLGSHRSPYEEIREISVTYITNTPKDIPKGGHTIVQFHLLLESIGYMNCMK
jgi:hypothetical protein